MRLLPHTPKPCSFILNFAYTEALENSKNYQEVHNVFGKFIEVLHSEVERISKTVPESSLAANGNASATPQQQPSGMTTSSTSSIMTPEKELALRKRELGIGYIAYMRFARRAEGLKAARGVFSKARKDKGVSWEVYEAAGESETLIWWMTDYRRCSIYGISFQQGSGCCYKNL